MKILALDLGTKTGYAMEADGYPLSCGTLTLATKEILRESKRLRNDRRGDPRFFKLIDFLRSVAKSFGPEVVVFEDVQFSTFTQQVQLWATWRAAVWLVADENDWWVECCPVPTLKKFATGHGGADKDRMAKYLAQNSRFQKVPGGVYDRLTRTKLDDNAVDALHLLRWAKSTLQ